MSVQIQPLPVSEILTEYSRLLHAVRDTRRAWAEYPENDNLWNEYQRAREEYVAIVPSWRRNMISEEVLLP